MVIDHSFYMSLALKEAWTQQILTFPNPSVGALILDKEGKILAIEATQAHGQSHAELHAIERAMIEMGDKILETLKTPNEKHAHILRYHDNRFKGCTIYTTLEPCNHQGKTPACSALIKELGFKKLFCGSIDPNQDASGGLQTLQNAGIETEVGILKSECDTLLTPFRKYQQKKPFVFFKLALSANGVYDGGIITSKTSRTHVHQMRNAIDLLVVGGETVRVDRPTLDSRMVAGKAPDILILSHHKEFDKSIPLFSVEGRKVFIEENFDKIKQYRFIMIEGAEMMLQASAAIVDWYCIFSSSTMKKGKTLQIEKGLQRLQLMKNEHETITWFQKKDL